MSITSNVFVRATAVLLLVGFFALLGIVGTTIWLVERTQVYFNEVVVSREIRSAATDLRIAFAEAETGQRGYLLTGNESYLEPYNTAVAQLPTLQRRLVTVLAADPEAQDALADLQGVIDFKLDELARTIELTRSGQRDAALAIVNSNAGNESMDRTRDFLVGLVASAQERLDNGVVDQRNAAAALRWVAILGALVIVGVAGSSLWIALAYTKEIGRARREVEEANESLEARVQERTADLGKANEEIQRFAYIVTHDLRAPLVNIMGFTSELETSVATLRDYMGGREESGDPKFADARLAATEDLPEAIGFIRSSTRKMDALINAILKISREGRRQLKPETLNLSEIIDASVSAIQHQVTENGGSVSTEVKVARITSDRLSLEQVLGNLLDNSVKYQEPGRPLAVAIRVVAAERNRLNIEVEDNGRGIAATDHERVFELFRRSGAQSKPGEGIGLAHVRTLVRSLGGEITLSSQLGVGTTFKINLPRDLRSHIGSNAK